MGTLVMDGKVASLGQTWWHSSVKYLAGGRTEGISLRMERKVFSKMRPAMSPRSWFLATSLMLTAPPRLWP